jgi:hypothetical protein
MVGVFVFGFLVCNMTFVCSTDRLGVHQGEPSMLKNLADTDPVEFEF